MPASIDDVEHGWGTALRGLLATRMPDALGTPAGARRPLLPWWPFLVAAGAEFLIALGIFGGQRVEVIAYGALRAVPAILARQRPVLAALTDAVLVLLSIGAPLVLGPGMITPPWFLDVLALHAVIAYALGLSVATRALTWLLGAMFAAGLTYALVVQGLSLSTTPIVLEWVAVLVVPALLGARRRDRHVRDLAALEETGRRRVRDEHDRVARELHDAVAHHMSELAVRAASASKRIPDVPDAAAAEFAELGGLARSALGEMRQLLGVLRGDPEPAQRAPQPGLAELSELVASAERAGTPVELSLNAPSDVPAGIAVSVYRIVQEALSNVARHATGAPTVVHVGSTGSELRVRIANAAPGMAPPAAPGAGLGLVGMRERVRILGGRLDVGPVPDGGFAVDARLPLEHGR